MSRDKEANMGTPPKPCGAGGCTNLNPPVTPHELVKCFYDGTPCWTGPGGSKASLSARGDQP